MVILPLNTWIFFATDSPIQVQKASSSRPNLAISPYLPPSAPVKPR